MTEPVRKLTFSEAGKLGNSVRKTHGNQWTKRREELDSEGQRKRIKIGLLQARLHSCAMGRIKMDQTAVAAAKVLIDKALPTLQAVETIHSEPAMTASEPDLLAALRRLIAENPELVHQILSEQAKPVDECAAMQQIPQVIDPIDDTTHHAEVVDT